MMRFIVFCGVVIGLLMGRAEAEETCTVCHRVAQRGAHAALPCLACHLREDATIGDPAHIANRAVGCATCHGGHERIFDHAMAVPSGKCSSMQHRYATPDSGFWETNCGSCHIQGCQDCHGNGHAVTTPAVGICQGCHRGYFAGWDASARSPRADEVRYQGGIAASSATLPRPLPDVHYASGLTCGACHSMTSLAQGQSSSKGCQDCHIPHPDVIEHRILAHLERLECYACHSPWASRKHSMFRDEGLLEGFESWEMANAVSPGYAFLLNRDALIQLNLPPLAVPSPFAGVYSATPLGYKGLPENFLLAGEVRAWASHAVQRSSVTCDQCHHALQRFLLEPGT
ncbi:MAG TPA: selenite/tellurite reduction operon b-type cytochrome iron-sulfur cluster-binding subunit ExtO [Geobacteraceae bacterium]